MEKIAFCIQHYGEKVRGGSIDLCDLLAEALVDRFEIDIITFKKNDDVKIEQIEANKRIVYWPQKQAEQASNSLGLKDYKAVIVIEYCNDFLTVINGLENVYFMPLAHDEIDVRNSIFKQIAKKAKGFLFLTPEEKCLVEKYNPNNGRPVGVSFYYINKNKSENSKLNGLPEEYILYAGRLSSQKNYYELNDFFERYKKRNKNNLKLVTIGAPYDGLARVSSEDILNLGYIDESAKKDVYENAVALIIPSLFESLSIVLLEALYYGTPVIVNEKSDVLKGQCKRSGGGFWYGNFEEFEIEINKLYQDKNLNNTMAQSGFEYVQKKYAKAVVVERLIGVLNNISDIDMITAADTQINSSEMENIKNLVASENLLPSRSGIDYRRFIRSLKTMDEIVIVGGGNVGRHLYQLMKDEGVSGLVAVADNNAKSTGGFDGKIEYISIDAAAKKYPRAYYIVTPINAMWVIIEQLVELGIDKEKIETYSLEYHLE